MGKSSRSRIFRLKIVPDVKEQKNQENGDLPLSEEQFYLEPIES
jgi:hypothetical protein